MLFDGRPDKRANNRGSDSRVRPGKYGWPLMRVGEIKQIPIPRVEGKLIDQIHANEQFANKIFRNMYSYNARSGRKLEARDAMNGCLIVERVK